MNKFNYPNKQNNYQDTNRLYNEFEPKWISESLMYKSAQKKDAVEFAEELAKEIVSNYMTTSQIRNFFGEVRRIQMKGIKNEKVAFLLLKPKLAYAAKRHDNKGIRQFKDIITKSHEIVMEVKDDEKKFLERFKNFVDFLEAILAYHKVHGGK